MLGNSVRQGSSTWQRSSVCHFIVINPCRGYVESELISRDWNISHCSFNNVRCGLSLAGKHNATCRFTTQYSACIYAWAKTCNKQTNVTTEKCWEAPVNHNYHNTGDHFHKRIDREQNINRDLISFCPYRSQMISLPEETFSSASVPALLIQCYVSFLWKYHSSPLNPKPLLYKPMPCSQTLFSPIEIYFRS